MSSVTQLLSPLDIKNDNSLAAQVCHCLDCSKRSNYIYIEDQ